MFLQATNTLIEKYIRLAGLIGDTAKKEIEEVLQ